MTATFETLRAAFPEVSDEEIRYYLEITAEDGAKPTQEDFARWAAHCAP